MKRKKNEFLSPLFVVFTGQSISRVLNVAKCSFNLVHVLKNWYLYVFLSFWLADSKYFRCHVFLTHIWGDFQDGVQDGCHLQTSLIFVAYSWPVCQIIWFRVNKYKSIIRLIVNRINVLKKMTFFFSKVRQLFSIKRSFFYGSIC